jgi:hypothetical protein
MKASDVAHHRLRNQHLSSPDSSDDLQRNRRPENPEDVVQWMGAVQAQDYGGAKWAVAQRMRLAAEGTIEKAFADGRLLRTHVMRPTWHFVAPGDIRWMLRLTAPRVNAAMASYYRKFELDQAVFTRSHKALARALRGGRQLTRDTLRLAVQRAGIASEGLRFLFILARAELDGVICSGAREGRQFTYALVEERVPPARPLTRDEALAALTARYFASHGPATVQDFVWWSGLTARDAKAGLDMAGSSLAHESISGRTYWLSASNQPVGRAPLAACLLPPYDEYLVAYKDRSAAVGSAASRRPAANAILGPTIVLDGRVVGTWKRTLGKRDVTIALNPFSRIPKAGRRAISEAARAYSAFLGANAVLEWAPGAH